jgi:hypothetical protein
MRSKPAGRRLAACQLALGLHELVERLLAVGQVSPPALGQANAAGGAHKQAHLQPLFQPADRPADRCGREPGLRGGGSKAVQLSRQAEKLDAAQHHLVELPRHELLRVMNEVKLWQFISVCGINNLVSWHQPRKPRQ